MRRGREKMASKIVFRAIFALEKGGGQIEIRAEDHKKAWALLKEVEPDAWDKIKTFEAIEAC
jgi:hypothetical protein